MNQTVVVATILLSLFITPVLLGQTTNMTCAEWRSRIGLPPLTEQLPVTVTTVSYASSNWQNQPTNATGMIAHHGEFADSPMLVYHHGTIFARNEAPSVAGSAANMLAQCVLVQAGYSVVMPDYQGLGGGEGFHPYLHKESTARATIDLLNVIAPNPSQSIYLSGYSQGGYSTLATLQALERIPQYARRLVASAPMAGPYNLDGVSLSWALGDPVPGFSSLYVLYLLKSYQMVYGNVWSNRREVFKRDWIQAVDYLDGIRTADDLLQLVPLYPQELLSERFLEGVRSGVDSPLLRYLEDNDVSRWKARSRIHFIYAGSDRSVSPDNASVTFAFMRSQGSPVSRENIGNQYNHSTGFGPSVQAALRWFESLR